MSKGKNFSANRKRSERNKSDFYQTPYSMTEQLLEQGILPSPDEAGIVLEPASGKGAIVKVLVEKGYSCRAIDIEKGIDFLTWSSDHPYKWAVCNPPFRFAKEFVVKMKEICSKGFFVLLPLSYLHGVGRLRMGLYRGLKTIYVFARYPMLSDEIREDGKYNTGMMVYMWAYWENGYEGDPAIKWIDNQKYILSKRDTK